MRLSFSVVRSRFLWVACGGMGGGLLRLKLVIRVYFPCWLCLLAGHVFGCYLNCILYVGFGLFYFYVVLVFGLSFFGLSVSTVYFCVDVIG